MAGFRAAVGIAVTSRVSSVIPRWRREWTESLVGSLSVASGCVSAVRWVPVHTCLSRRHGGRMVFAAGSPGGNCRAVPEISRTRGGGDGGTSMIACREVLPVLAGSALVLALHIKGAGVPFTGVHLLLPRRAGIDASPSAVETGGGSVADDNSAVIYVGHVGDADVGDGAVVIKRASTPFATRKTEAAVPESVVDAPIEADMRSPV